MEDKYTLMDVVTAFQDSDDATIQMEVQGCVMPASTAMRLAFCPTGVRTLTAEWTDGHRMVSTL